MKKFAMALMAMSATIFGFGMVAEAQYGGISETVVASPTTVAPGGTITLTITGCTSGETLTITLDGVSVTATCADGSAVAQLAAPNTAGTYPGTVVGSQGFNQSFTVVVAQAAVPPGGLPATGSSGMSGTLSTALGLFVVGLGLFAVARIRRRATPTLA